MVTNQIGESRINSYSKNNLALPVPFWYFCIMSITQSSINDLRVLLYGKNQGKPDKLGFTFSWHYCGDFCHIPFLVGLEIN